MERDLKLYEKYSPEHDGLMLVDLTIVKNAYDAEFVWSFSLPNDATGMVEKDFMDGMHPIYEKTTFRYVLDGMGLTEKDVLDADGDYEVLADYPRYGSTLRFLFKNWVDAVSALAKVKKELGLMETVNVN